MRRKPEIENLNVNRGDFTERTKQMFEIAGDDVDPITIKSNTDAIAELEYLFKTIRKSVQWDRQVEAIRRGMGLLKGGILKFESFRSGVRRFNPGLCDAATNLRAALVKEACLFIAQIAKTATYDVDVFGDFIRPVSKQLPHGTQIISDSCKFAILSIVKNCPTHQVLRSVLDVSKEGGVKQRAVMSEALSLVVQTWPLKMLEAKFEEIKLCLHFLVGEASPITRLFARISLRTLAEVFPKRKEEIMMKLSAKTLEAIEAEQPLPNVIRLKFREPAPVVKQNRPRYVKEEELEAEAREEEDKQRQQKEFQEKVAARIREVAQEFFQPEEEEEAPDPKRIKICGVLMPKGLKLRKAKPWYKPYEYKRPPRVKEGTFLQRNAPPKMSVDESKHIPDSEKEAVKAKLKKQKEMRKKSPPKPKPEPAKEDASKAVTTPKPKTGDFLQRNGLQETPLEESKHVADKDALQMRLERQKEIDRQRQRRERRERKAREQLEEEKHEKANRIKEIYKSPAKLLEGSPKRTPRKQYERIELVEGQEFDFIQNVRAAVDDKRTGQLKASGESIAEALLACCSHNSVQIASASLQLLPDLLPSINSFFAKDLEKYVDLLLGLVENGNPKLSAHALFALNEFPKYFDLGRLIGICCDEAPSFPLLSFTVSLTEMVPNKIITNGLITKLCRLAQASYNMFEVRSRHLSARIIRRCDTIDHAAVLEFGNSLPDNQLRDFEQFIKAYIPELTFRNVVIEVPPFNVKGDSLWRNRIAQIANNASLEEWKLVRQKVLAELNLALLSKKSLDPTLRLIQTIFSFRGCDDYDRILPGLIVTAKDDVSKIGESLLTSILRAVPVQDVISAIQPLIEPNNSPETSKNAIDTETRILATVPPELLQQSVSTVVAGLKTAMENPAPEVRRSAVYCFVELYKILGKGTMDAHLSCLSRAHQELVLIFCAKHHIA